MHHWVFWFSSIIDRMIEYSRHSKAIDNSYKRLLYSNNFHKTTTSQLVQGGRDISLVLTTRPQRPRFRGERLLSELLPLLGVGILLAGLVNSSCKSSGNVLLADRSGGRWLTIPGTSILVIRRTAGLVLAGSLQAP